MIKAASLPLAACLLVTFHPAVVTLPYSQLQAGNLTDTPTGLYPAPSLVDTASPTPPALDSVKILTSGPTHLLPVSLTDTGSEVEEYKTENTEMKEQEKSEDGRLRSSNGSPVLVFLAAAVGIGTVLGIIYCVYSRVTGRDPYSHRQLTEETDSSLYFSGSRLVLTPLHQYYGSSSQPSTIPVLESEPPVLPVSPQRLRASTDQLEIISASDLQRNFI
ncbi:uncharacterized protein LOC131724972 [Acipenser ruthenus]|uniref:uncharacterized protein LOC131724972 n=1 Tax=Acipenser ruthenus TaxID=7906 RepID=UPI0027421E7C|nr:uncharacterized protein LOC131724972 [Acipenser ruthenus]